MARLVCTDRGDGVGRPTDTIRKQAQMRDLCVRWIFPLLIAMAGVASKASNNFLNIRTLLTSYNSLLLKLYSGYVLHNTNLRNGIFFPI